MIKKTTLGILFTLAALSAAAQDRLIVVDSESLFWRSDSPQLAFFDKEMARLLMPAAAAFGVVCIPSHSQESTLAYDSVAHALVYNVAQESIWHATYNAMYKKKIKVKKEGTVIKRKLRKQPKDYVAPGVKTFSLAVTPEQAQKLQAVWTNAVSRAEYREDNMLDGVKWEYFVGGKRAKTHQHNSDFVKFTNQLAEAVRTGNASRKDSLIAESQRFIVP